MTTPRHVRSECAMSCRRCKDATPDLRNGNGRSPCIYVLQYMVSSHLKLILPSKVDTLLYGFALQTAMTSIAGIRPLNLHGPAPDQRLSLGKRTVLELFVQSYSILFTLKRRPGGPTAEKVQGTLEALLFSPYLWNI